jgi:hypothetical protein
MIYNIGDVILTVSDEKILREKFINKIGIILEYNDLQKRGTTYKIMLCGMKQQLKFTNGMAWFEENSIKEVLYKSEK